MILFPTLGKPVFGGNCIAPPIIHCDNLNYASLIVVIPFPQGTAATPQNANTPFQGVPILHAISLNMVVKQESYSWNDIVNLRFV
jgi:hypothetical protein